MYVCTYACMYVRIRARVKRGVIFCTALLGLLRVTRTSLKIIKKGGKLRGITGDVYTGREFKSHPRHNSKGGDY